MPKDTATEIKPVPEKNIAAYGLPALNWERALKRIQEEWKLQAPPEMGGVPGPHTHWLATTRPDGRPHVVPIGAAWHEGHFCFTAADGTRKAKNLAQNPHCVITLAAKDLDITLEGKATKVTDDVRNSAVSPRYSPPAAGPPRSAAAPSATSTARRAPGPRRGTSMSSRRSQSSPSPPPSRTARRVGVCSPTYDNQPPYKP